MFLIFRSSIKRGRGLVVCCAWLVGLASLLGFGIVYLRSNGAASAKTEATNPASAVVLQDTSRHLTAEVVTLRPAGFEPALVTRSQGQFLLGVNNQTGKKDLTYGLSGKTATVNHRLVSMLTAYAGE